jgi:hypothetical protein
MKKFSTLVLGLFAVVAGAYAQSNFVKVNDGARPTAKIANSPLNTPRASDNRATTESIALDYSGLDENYAQTVSGGNYQGYSWNLNKRFSNNDDLTLDWLTVVFDTLVQLDGSGNILSYPKSATSFTLDGIDMLFNHTRAANANANNYDTIVISVYDRASIQVSGVGTPAGNLTGSVLWDTTIITNTSLSASATQYDVLSMQPQLSFATGNTFGVRVDFSGDTANQFSISAGGRDDCAQECLVAPSAVGFNTYIYLNWTAGANNEFDNTGLYNNQIYFDCNSSGGPDGCENIFIQNAVIVPYLTATVQYGANISSDKTAVCPNEVVTLTANPYGAAGPFTYNWSASSGTLTSNSDQQVSLVAGTTNSIVNVTVTDANNATTTATFTVPSRGINVSFTNNPQPVAISCGGATATLIAAVSGNTQGRNFAWSTGATGANTVSQQVSAPGTYRVTVTNNSNCSASASIEVVYNNGANNTVSFSPPADANAQQPGIQLCINAPATFVNTSSKIAGWNPTWSFGDTNLGTSVDGVNAYQAVGQYQVTLTMDSANCAFTSAPLTVNVLSASSGPCVTGINDIEFSNDVTLMPNPTTGNVTVSVAGVEKALSIKVYNILGSEVYNFNTSDVASTMNKQLDLNALSSGTYLVKVQTGNKIAIKRVTVSK